MYLVFSDLLPRFDHSRLHDYLIIYVDDTHLRWHLHCISSGLTTLNDLSYFLHIFQIHAFVITMSQSVVLFRAIDRILPIFTKI